MKRPSRQQVFKTLKYSALGALPGIIWFTIAGSTQSVIVGCLVLFVAFAFSLPGVSVERVLSQTALSFIPAPIHLVSELMNLNKEEKEPLSEICTQNKNKNGVEDPKDRDTPAYKILFAYFAMESEVFPDPENIVVGCLFQKINADLLLSNLILNYSDTPRQSIDIDHLFQLTDEAIDKEGSPEKAFDALAPKLDPEYEKKLLEIQTRFHQLAHDRLVLKLQFSHPPLVDLIALAKIGVFKGDTTTKIWTILWCIEGDLDPYLVYIDHFNGSGPKHETGFLITQSGVQKVPILDAANPNSNYSFKDAWKRVLGIKFVDLEVVLGTILKVVLGIIILVLFGIKVFSMLPKHEARLNIEPKIVPQISNEVLVSEVLALIEKEMVMVPAEKFMMGHRSSSHQVTLTKPFYMGKCEVTQEQWQAVMNNKSTIIKPKFPISEVSWNDCQDFIKNLNMKTEGGYRLPTEAEWEYACRAGTKTDYSFGDSLTKSDANIADAIKIYGNFAVAVGSYKANAFGLYDMHGNVWEWCEDRHGGYPKGSVTDPMGPAEGEARVLRGGSFNHIASNASSFTRSSLAPNVRYDFLGLRLARTP